MRATVTWGENVYYSPESHNLTKIGEIDPHESYEFNTLVAWQHEDGRIFWASDSGCSCPTPFEYTKFEDLHEITDFDSFRYFCNTVDDWCSYRDSDRERFNADKVQFKAKVGEKFRTLRSL